jgi:hypothetical protein
MTDHFDKWINSMSDDEYDSWLDAPYPIGASDAQEAKALNIREKPTQEEMQELEALQEFQEEQEVEAETRELEEQDKQRKEDKRIYKEETRAPIRERFTISEGITEIPQSIGEPVTIKKIGERVTMTRMPTLPTNIPVQVPPRVIPQRPQVRSIPSRIRNAVSSGISFARRLFRV